MDGVLATAGVLCILLAAGHATLGLVWVLPGVSDEHLPRTPFGSPRLSAATIHASWHIVTVMASGLGVLLIVLASDAATPRTMLLRTIGLIWLGVAAVAVWTGGRRVRRVRDLLRLPVPVLFVVVAVLCWVAST